MESQFPVAMAPNGHGGENGQVTSVLPRRASIGIDPHAVDPATVLSAEELELLQRRFARYNPNSNKTRALTAAHAIELFRDEFPSLSDWEIQSLFEKCDLNRDGRLALQEYLQTRAYYRLVMEAESEQDIVRSFTILDTDNDGILVADEVLVLVEQAKQSGAQLLKQVIVRAARATREAASGQHQRSHPGREDLVDDLSKGEITLEHFVITIRDINRGIEQEIAAKTLRLLAREDKLETLQKAQLDATISGLHRANLLSKIQSTKLEIDVLKTEVARSKKETLSESGSNSALGSICETLVASYENEQHVYECLGNLITYCGLKDPDVFRYNLEQSGREVHVLDSILMTPPLHVKQSAEYMEMTELAIHHINIDRSTTQTQPSSRSNADPHRVSAPEKHTNRRYDRLKLNSTLRRQFVFYTMLGDVTNLESMTRCTFLKFVKDCELHLLTQPPLSDPDSGSIFSRATNHHASLHATSPRARPHATASPRATGGMVFADWLVACDLIFQRACLGSSEELLNAEQLETLIKKHVVAKAKCIQTQNLAPDISQYHVLKLLRENLWQLRQIFFHFGAQSLLEADSKVTLDMREFLQFARAFKILRASAERDGEPYSPPPLTESTVIQPISLLELIREFYAAKLDISFSNPLRRDKLDLNFREFSRCVQRVAMAMHAQTSTGTTRRNLLPNGILTTSFEAVKEDEDRKPHHPATPLYNRRGNILGASVSPTKSCKMTTTSIISRLLHTSRALGAGTVPLYDGADANAVQKPPQYARSLTKVYYGSSGAASTIPVMLPLVEGVDESRKGAESASQPKPHDTVAIEPWVPLYRPVSVPMVSPRAPASPRTPRRPRPITCGGPAIVRVIKAPSDR